MTVDLFQTLTELRTSPVLTSTSACQNWPLPGTTWPACPIPSASCWKRPAQLRRQENHPPGCARPGQLAAADSPAPADALLRRACGAARFHRRAGDERPGRHARGPAPAWAATRSRSTRSSRSTWSSTIPSRSITSARRMPSSATRNWNSSATASATSSCTGRRKPSDNFRVVPPATGIVHQVNLEYLARVVLTQTRRRHLVFPDTLVGTDSHTTMINGLGVVGWGVGGIEAVAAMLGQPIEIRHSRM